MDLRAGDDRGETLIEIVVALAIFGIAAVAILSGLQFGVKASDIHRKEAKGGASVRSFAEAVQNYVANGGYDDCAVADAYTSAVAGSYDLDLVKYKPVQSKAWRWNGTAWSNDCSTANDLGLQRVTLTVESRDGRASESMTLVLRRPCNGAVSTPCA